MKCLEIISNLLVRKKLRSGVFKYARLSGTWVQVCSKCSKVEVQECNSSLHLSLWLPLRLSFNFKSKPHKYSRGASTPQMRCLFTAGVFFRFICKRSVGEEIQCKLASLQCLAEDWLGTLDYWLASKCPTSSPLMCPPRLSELGSRCANEPKKTPPSVIGFVVQMFISMIKWAALLAAKIVFVKVLICAYI